MRIPKKCPFCGGVEDVKKEVYRRFEMRNKNVVENSRLLCKCGQTYCAVDVTKPEKEENELQKPVRKRATRSSGVRKRNGKKTKKSAD
jgi:biotin synthase-like enzyme